MATALSIQTAKTPFATISANQLDITFAAGDVAGNTFACTGKELLLIKNSHATDPFTWTATSVADEKNRTGDITTYSLAAGEDAYWTGGLTTSQGWMDANKLITVTPSSTSIKFAVLRLP